MPPKLNKRQPQLLKSSNPIYKVLLALSISAIYCSAYVFCIHFAEPSHSG